MEDEEQDGPVLDAAKGAMDEAGDAEFEYDEKAAIPVKICLFCGKNCKTLEKSLKHMLKKHGFFIPFSEYLTDLEGMLVYLGAKVGIGKVCLYCNGRGKLNYDSVASLQKHMTAKSHCKIRLDDDEDDDEFMPFYKFPKSSGFGDRPMGGAEGDEGDEGDEGEADQEAGEAVEGGQVAVVAPNRRRHLKGMNELNELVMTDGALIGHRENKRAYNQNTRPVTADDEQRAMLGRYRQIGDISKKERQAKYSEAEHRFFKKQIRVKLNTQFRANKYDNFRDSTAQGH